MQVLDHCIQIQAFEFLRVIKLFAHRIRQLRVLVENLNVQLVRPPLAVRRCGGSCKRALRFTCHVSLQSSFASSVSPNKNHPSSKANKEPGPASQASSRKEQA